MPTRSSFKTREEFNKWHREYRARNRKRIRSYNRKYNRLHRIKNGYRYEKVYRSNNTQKIYARNVLQYNIRKGRIVRGKCRVCGKKNAEAHHDNYLEPLKVKWFCPLHHAEYERLKK